MTAVKFCLAGNTPALHYTKQTLKNLGYCVSDVPSPDISHLLLPVPSFEADGSIKGGGRLENILAQLPEDIIVLGGILKQPTLKAYRCTDLLQDELYTAQNANITAHCALRLAMNKLPTTLENLQVLVIGWGRIGKCLAKLLSSIGADVTVAARKESDRAILTALGYRAIDTKNIDTLLYRIIFNTAPQMVCPECPGNELKIDLASKPGLGADDVIWARGLPGKDAPESSGRLIAETIHRLIQRKE